MNVFKNEQTTVEIAGIPLGGQPGELPTVLIGSFGHPGHKIIQDFQKGSFDKTEAEKELRRRCPSCEFNINIEKKDDQ